jgi:hypothetical protein
MAVSLKRVGLHFTSKSPLTLDHPRKNKAFLQEGLRLNELVFQAADLLELRKAMWSYTPMNAHTANAVGGRLGP